MSLAAALFSFCLPGAAQAQVNGVWQTDLGQMRLDISRASTNPAPQWIRTTTTFYEGPGGNRTVLEGAYNNLAWEGRWFFYGSTPRPGMSNCLNPHGTRNAPTSYYGSFRVTFNAAENSFTGVMTNCMVPVTDAGRRRSFNGQRENTITAAAPRTTPVPGGGIVSNPSREGSPPPSGEDFCRDRRILAVPFSDAFASRPCVSTAGERIQIDTLVSGSQRPTTVIFRGFTYDLRTAVGARAAGSVPVTMTGRSFRLGLPFQSVPSVSTPYTVTLPGGVCRDIFWLVNLLMSDGTETPAIGILFSGCGPRLPASPGDGPRPVGPISPTP